MAEIDQAAVNSRPEVVFDGESWELYGPEGVQVQAASGQLQLAFSAGFAQSRRMPEHVPAADLLMVVVGWAAEDSRWHVGLLLGEEMATARGGRWCGLARWTPADAEAAREAGEALAALLNRPFRFVPPSESAPEIPLMPLPLELAEWRLEEDSQGLALRRSRHWRRGMWVRGGLCVMLIPVFGLLSLGALGTTYAAVQPTWLPLLGLGITIILIGLAILQFGALTRNAHVLIDRRAGMVRRLARGRVSSQVPFEGIDNLLISHVLNRRRAAEGVPVQAVSAETWLHGHSTRRGFILICQIADIEGEASLQEWEGQRPLDLRLINTPAHHAAAHIGRLIGVPVYMEPR